MSLSRLTTSGLYYLCIN